MNAASEKTSKYMTVKDWVSTFGYIPEGGLRHLIFINDSFNEKVVKRIGKKVLLDIQAMENWISEQKGNNKQLKTKSNKKETPKCILNE